MTAAGAVVSAGIAALGTFGAAAITGKSPTTIVVGVWNQVTGTGSDTGTAEGSRGGTRSQQGPRSNTTFHTDPLKITYRFEDNRMDGVRVDLDASPADPQWGVVTLAENSQYDLAWWSKDRGTNPPAEGVGFLNAAQGVVLDSADDATCQAATGYANHVPYTDLEAGRALCVVTSEKRYAVLHITERSEDGNTLGLDVRTFKKASDK
ncbi:MAG: hypothetical protein QG622_3095 [Actinomycetota bacterium]|nr:hypothetical protein [Actinomycetota bacterium]